MLKKFSYSIILLILSTYCFSQDITGDWLGTLDIMGNKLRVGFNITKEGTTYRSTMNSPDQGAFKLPTTKTVFSDRKIEITATQLGILYQGTLEADSISGKFTQGRITVPLMLKRTEKPTLPKRPQTPEAPFPYKTEEVFVQNRKDSLTLAGTLTLPEDKEKVPAVILIAGSGPNDRDETILGHKPFLVLADHLTKNGIAVLRYDKRGVKQSTGNYAQATTYDFAKDVEVLHKWLAKRSEIDSDYIGLIGHSEGGIIAPIVAGESSNIAFIVSMAAPGLKGIEIVMYQNELAMKQQNMEPENIEDLLKANREILESLKDWKNSEDNRTQLRDKLNTMWNKMPLLTRLKLDKEQYIRNNLNAMTAPWYSTFLHLDPTEYLRKVDCPVLILNGEKDTQVVASENPEKIKEALEEGGNNRSEIKIYPNLNHLFQESETGFFDEYATIEQTISPEVLDDISNWIKEQKNYQRDKQE